MRHRTCFFHVGMPKTGTSSIQSVLYKRLSNPRFQYVSFGEINGSRGMSTLFEESPSDFVWNRLVGLDGDALERYRRRLQRRLQRGICYARRRDADLIISAESGWNMTAAALNRAREFLEREGYRVRVVVYLRPWLSYLPSILQERLKNGLADMPAVLRHESLAELLDYVARMDRLTKVFGNGSVECHRYDRGELHRGCVVQDFFQRIAAGPAPSDVTSDNDSLGVEACKLLYAYNRHHFPRVASSRWLSGRASLIWHLSQLRSDPFRLSPTLLKPLSPFLAEQQRRLLQRHGVALPLPIDQMHRGGGICDEPDLLSPLPSTVEWLARTSRSPNASSPDPAERSREIADQVARIAAACGLAGRLRLHRANLLREWRHFTTGA